jgi:rSAM/selenodomain-associated transferase 1
LKILQEDLLIILVKNPIRGKVKTRLAADLGKDVSLKVYKKLIDITFRAIEPLKIDKWILYSDFIEGFSDSPDQRTSRGVQQGKDLGERMMQAFTNGFNAGYRHICIIGSDCYDLRPEIIQEGFELLCKYDFILGPSTDGGYYLLGINFLFEDIFIKIPWSTSTVLESTLQNIRKKSYSYFLLEELTDIDTKADLEFLKIDLKKFLKS